MTAAKLFIGVALSNGRFDGIGSNFLMRDVFDYDSPFGLLGKVADYIFLKGYMTTLLKGRNKLIKEAAERSNH
jgi:hypothetical protein